MGRTDEMSSGIQYAQDPLSVMKRNYQMLTQASGYRPTSALDNVLPNQNGLGTADLDRRRMGVPSSINGISNQTFDKNLWLRAASQTARYDSTFNSNY